MIPEPLGLLNDNISYHDGIFYLHTDKRLFLVNIQGEILNIDDVHTSYDITAENEIIRNIIKVDNYNLLISSKNIYQISEGKVIAMGLPTELNGKSIKSAVTNENELYLFTNGYQLFKFIINK
jgi:hypothetical protein